MSATPMSTGGGMRARVNGVDLHYEVVGSGTPMFVVGLLECELYQRLLPESMTDPSVSATSSSRLSK